MTLRRTALTTALLAGLLMVGGTATAQPTTGTPPTTTTTTEHDVVETFVDVAPSCEEGAPLYTITTTSNRIAHETIFADGRVHSTFTDTGTFSADPLDDASLPSYTGKFTVWGGFNANGKTVNGTFTFSVHGSGSDGSTLSNHVTEHFNQLPDGTVHEFFKCH